MVWCYTFSFQSNWSEQINLYQFELWKLLFSKAWYIWNECHKQPVPLCFFSNRCLNIWISKQPFLHQGNTFLLRVGLPMKTKYNIKLLVTIYWWQFQFSISNFSKGTSYFQTILLLWCQVWEMQKRLNCFLSKAATSNALTVFRNTSNLLKWTHISYIWWFIPQHVKHIPQSITLLSVYLGFIVRDSLFSRLLSKYIPLHT